MNQAPDPMLSPFLERTAQPRPGRPPLPTRVHVPLPRPSGPGLRAAARELATDADDLVLAAFATVLHRYSGERHVTIAIGGSPEQPSRARVFAFPPGASLRSVLGSAQASAAPSPFVVTVNGDLPDEYPGDAATLAVAVTECDGGLSVQAGFDRTRLSEAMLTRAMAHLGVLLDAAIAAPDLAVSELPMLTEGERAMMLVEWNDTAGPVVDSCIHEQFETVASATPDATALIQDDVAYSFGDVNRRANQLAHRLKDLGVGPHTRVGLYLHRTPALVVAMLAIMKAGGAYIPIDPEFPQERVVQLIEAANCAVTITGSAVTRARYLGGSAVLCLDTEAAAIAAQRSDNPDAVVSPMSLCYVMFTSGSSGAPKAIALRHRGVLNNLLDLNDRLHVDGGDRVVSVSAQTFDMSVYELLGLGLAGACVVLPAVGRHRDLRHLAALLRRHDVTVWSSTPALLEAVLDDLDFHGDTGVLPLRVALLAGDWIPATLPERIRQRAPGSRFIALGGATEASVYSTIFEVDAVEPAWTTIPYGVPMRNQRAYILDAHDAPVPIGVAGELHLAGLGLAEGYVDQPVQTAERFVERSLYPAGVERLYRTGDMARYGEDGVIELLGRLDFQVKVNGVRIELGEIEAALLRSPEVKSAVVVTRPHGGTDRLVGYVVPEVGQVLLPEVLRTRLATMLPHYMVVATIVVIPAMPLGLHGKVDRAALPDPAPLRNSTDGPLWTDEVEHRIATIFGELLAVDGISRDASLVGLGVDSMDMLRAMSRIDPGLTWADMVQCGTIAGLAARVRSMTRDGGRAEIR